MIMMSIQEVTDIINNLSETSVFENPTAWNTDTNAPYKFLMSCFETNKPLIKEKVDNIIKDFVDRETISICKDEINSKIYETIEEIYRRV